MQPPLIEERTEALRTRSGSNGRHPMVEQQKHSAGQAIGREDIIKLLWVVLWAAIVLAALVMATGTVAMLVRSVMTLFGFQP